LGGKQFGIKRILGKPDAFPQAGSSANAWSPKKALDGYEWVEVSFEKSQTVKQVAVFENLNAGCVVKISVATASGKYETVWKRKKEYTTPTFKSTIPTDRAYYFKRKRRKVQDVPDVLNPGIEYAILDNTVSGVVAVRVEFNFALLPGQKQIDAIGISDSEMPIQANINTNETFEKLALSKQIQLDGIVPFNPVISLDGTTLFVTNSNDDKTKIFSFTKDSNGNWVDKKVEANLNLNDTYNFLNYVGADFLLKGGATYSKGNTETGFELIAIKDGNYKPVGLIKVAAYNNYEDTADATMTADGKILIMGLESDFSQGGTDLYFAQQKEDGTYSFLQNMGKIINSANDEAMVQLLSDQKTLLFSSNGFSSFGDFDLYVAYRLDNTWKSWSEPINLGSKINSSGFDGSPFYDEKNETLYFITYSDSNILLKAISIPKIQLLQKD